MYLSGVASLLPYLAVYMRQIGLGPAETAIIYGTMPFIGAFVRGVVGALADKWRKHKQALVIVCFLTGILHACLLFVPSKVQGPCDITISTACGDMDSSHSYCPIIPGSANTVVTGVNLLNATPVPSESYSSKQAGLFSNCTLRCEPTQNTVCFKHDTGLDCLNTNCEENKTLTCFAVESDLVSYHPSGDCFDINLNDVTVDALNGNKTFNKMSCLSPGELSCKLTCKGDDFKNKGWADCSSEEMYGRTFWVCFVILLLGQIAFAPVFSLIDAMTYSHLGEERGKWGWNRLWGTVGFGIFAVVSALSMEVFQKSEQEKNFTLAFVLFAVLNVIASIIVYFYKFESDVVASQVMRNLTTLILRWDTFSLLIAVFAFGAYTGLIETFLYWHLEELGGNKVLVGLCMAVNCVPEIFILLIAGWLINKIGHVSCLYIVFSAYAIRMLAYSLLRNPWVVLAVEPLHSITFGLMFAAVSSYGSIITPPGMHGSIQGLIGALYFGAGKLEFVTNKEILS